MESKNFEKYSKKQIMEILLKTLDLEEKDSEKILNIFIFGSIVFKTSTENSGKKKFIKRENLKKIKEKSFLFSWEKKFHFVLNIKKKISFYKIYFFNIKIKII